MTKSTKSLPKGWGSYRCGHIEGDITKPMKRDNTLSKRLLEESINKVRQEYDKLVKDGILPEGQFDSFYAGYGIALLKLT